MEIEVHHDIAFQAYASFFIVACGWLNHFKDQPQFKTGFDGNFHEDIIIRKAYFPWARELKRGYWGYSGFIRWITHRNNEPVFHEHGSSRELLSYNDIRLAEIYLHMGLGLVF